MKSYKRIAAKKTSVILDNFAVVCLGVAFFQINFFGVVLGLLSFVFSCLITGSLGDE